MLGLPRPDCDCRPGRGPPAPVSEALSQERERVRVRLVTARDRPAPAQGCHRARTHDLRHEGKTSRRVRAAVRESAACRGDPHSRTRPMAETLD